MGYTDKKRENGKLKIQQKSSSTFASSCSRSLSVDLMECKATALQFYEMPKVSHWEIGRFMLIFKMKNT